MVKNTEDVTKGEELVNAEFNDVFQIKKNRIKPKKQVDMVFSINGSCV